MSISIGSPDQADWEIDLPIGCRPREMPSPLTSRQTSFILIGAAVLLSLGMGLRQSLGLFLPPVTRELGIAAADFTLAIAVQNIVWGLSQAPVGAIADRFGLRVTMLAGAVIYVIGMAVMAAPSGAAQLLVSGALIGIALSCTASSLALTAVARAVSEERRSKMLGLVSAGGSLGTLMVPLTTQSLLTSHAWQVGALFFVALAAMMIPAGFLAGGVDRVPAGGGGRVSMRETVGQAMRHRRFLVMSGAYFVCGLNLVFLGDASAGLSGAVRAGPDAERRGDRGDRRRQLLRLAGGGLARRALSEAHPAWGCSISCAPLCSPRISSCRRPRPRRCSSRRDGNAVAQRRAAGQRARSGNVRHPLYGDLARHFVCHASGRLVARRLWRRADIRHVRVL